MIERAEHRRSTSGEPTVFFLDEIHRFNKAQQDTLLPAVEEGLVVLVGATTENPYFEVNSALLSRCRVYELRRLERRARAGAPAACARRSRARHRRTRPRSADDALEFLAARSGGDARTALAALELACETTGGRKVTLRHAEDALQRKAVLYDKGADRHYDTISAWIKSTRGSDPDASLLYLAMMLEGGEDPRFIARRMVILASEDVGNADPRALAGGGGRRARRGARRPARVRPQPGPGGRVPRARPQVQRLLQGAGPRPRLGARARRAGHPAAPPVGGLLRGARARAGARATTTRTTARRASPSRS